MISPVSKSLLSALFGGAAAFFFAPMLWPLVMLLQPSGFWYWDSSLLAGLLAVAGFALAGGLLFGLFIGFPLLLFLQRFKLNNPFYLILAGGALSTIVFSELLSWPARAWPLYGYLFAVGGLCGAVAAKHNAL